MRRRRPVRPAAAVGLAGVAAVALWAAWSASGVHGPAGGGPAGGDAAPLRAGSLGGRPPFPPPPAARRRARAPVPREGTGRVSPVPGRSPASAGPGTRRFAVEIETGLGLPRRRTARLIERMLLDRRGWRRRGLPLRRVGGGRIDFRVTLAAPSTVDRLCAPLATRGRYSCFQRGRAVLNLERWRRGAPSYRGALGRYRRYMLNHEVGHALGHGHAGCPRRGARAPVMVQQTKGLGGCRPGPWPRRSGAP